MNQSEMMLLKTVTETDDKKALDYYSHWCKSIDFDRLEGGSFRLVPALYNRLSKIRTDLIHYNRMKGIYRYFLYKNACLSQQLHRVITLMAEAEIPLVLLKGSALIISYYDEMALRPMNDIDLLVKKQDVLKSLALLQDKGWSLLEDKEITALINSVNSITLKDQNGLELDLHWHVIYQSCWKGAEDIFWKNTESIIWRDQTVLILPPSLQLLHTIVHGLRWNELSSIRWVQDSCIILEKRGNDLDWSNLLESARQLHLLHILKIGLNMLRDEFNIAIPEDFVRHLNRIEEHPLEKKLYVSINSPSKLSYFKSKWYIYSIASNQKSVLVRLAGFPRYLKTLWNLSSYWSIPGLLIKKILFHLNGSNNKRK